MLLFTAAVVILAPDMPKSKTADFDILKTKKIFRETPKQQRLTAEL